jgi:hypothetical protein
MAASMDDLLEFQGEIWTRRDLFAEAFRLLDRVNVLLEGITERCEAREAYKRAMEAI